MDHVSGSGTELTKNPLLGGRTNGQEEESRDQEEGRQEEDRQEEVAIGRPKSRQLPLVPLGAGHLGSIANLVQASDRKPSGRKH